MDYLIELILEIVFEGYLELMFLIVPEEERTKKHFTIAIIVAATGFFGGIALFIWGAILIADHDNMLGIIPIAIAAATSLVQIITGIVIYIKRNKKSTEKGPQN